jgi:hypothetical protein
LENNSNDTIPATLTFLCPIGSQLAPTKLARPAALLALTEFARPFHSLLDSKNYEELLLESDEAFQRAESHEELLKFLAGVHSKLGASHDSTRTYIGVIFTTNGTLVKVTYQSTFERGKVTETFTWRKAVDGGLSLHGYDLQSNVFLSK